MMITWLGAWVAPGDCLPGRILVTVAVAYTARRKRVRPTAPKAISTPAPATTPKRISRLFCLSSS